MRSVIALYNDKQMSQSVLEDLINHGFEKERISVVSDGAEQADHVEEMESRLMRGLGARNIPRDNQEHYVESVRRGCSMIVVDTSDERADEASTILDNHAPVDLDEILGLQDTEGLEVGQQSERAEQRDERGEGIEVVEEDVQIGKRSVERAGVRVRSYVTEHPVEEDITLRDERVEVERRPVNEPLSTAAAEQAFQEESVEVRAHGEEPVVGKEARVVERIDIDKEVETRTEHVEATERRMDVDVERIGDEEELRRDWETNYKSQGMDFDSYRAAYTHGHRHGGEERHRDSEWSASETDLQRDWEEQNKDRGAWDKFRSAVQRGWDKARGG